jgi:hypothetical protein
VGDVEVLGLAGDHDRADRGVALQLAGELVELADHHPRHEVVRGVVDPHDQHPADALGLEGRGHRHPALQPTCRGECDDGAVKLLCLHADHFDYTFDHPTEGADERIPGEGDSFADAMVVFVAVERGDLEKINHAAKEVRRLAHKAGVARIVINPFVHLTSQPAPPAEARDESHMLADHLRETFDGEVAYTSFGWYKGFRIDVRGDEASMFFRHV